MLNTSLGAATADTSGLLQPEPPMDDLNRTVKVPATRWWRRLFAFIGPAYMVSVGYMDPGNWATDIAGGSQFGYALLWVLVMSSAMALLLQTLSARLGLVTGRDLAQACRDEYPAAVRYVLFVLTEIAIVATDLAEALGYGDVPRAIVRLARTEDVDLLVVGGHGHRALGDLVHGETIQRVRHGVSIPILAVR